MYMYFVDLNNSTSILPLLPNDWVMEREWIEITVNYVLLICALLHRVPIYMKHESNIIIQYIGFRKVRVGVIYISLKSLWNYILYVLQSGVCLVSEYTYIVCIYSYYSLQHYFDLLFLNLQDKFEVIKGFIRTCKGKDRYYSWNNERDKKNKKH